MIGVFAPTHSKTAASAALRIADDVPVAIITGLRPLDEIEVKLTLERARNLVKALAQPPVTGVILDRNERTMPLVSHPQPVVRLQIKHRVNNPVELIRLQNAIIREQGGSTPQVPLPRPRSPDAPTISGPEMTPESQQPQQWQPPSLPQMPPLTGPPQAPPRGLPPPAARVESSTSRSNPAATRCGNNAGITPLRRDPPAAE
jgi:hypothetical protein